MKKTIPLIALAVLIFFIGYSQNITTQQKKVSILAEDEIIIKTGGSSITMRKDGTILIKGKNIFMEGSGNISVKATGDLVMKGSKIGEN